MYTTKSYQSAELKPIRISEGVWCAPVLTAFVIDLENTQIQDRDGCALA